MSNVGNTVEALIHKVAKSRNPLLAHLVGDPTLHYQYNPEVNTTVIKRVERKIYGEKGLAVYEREKLLRRECLARRSQAQFLCQEAMIRNRLISVIRSFILLTAVVPLLLYLIVKSLIDVKVGRREDADVVIFGHFNEFRKVVEPLFTKERQAYHTVKLVHLGRKELTFLIRIMTDYPRLLLYPGLLFNLLRWLSYYGFIVYKYKPKIVVNFFEGVCSSSLMTAYLHEQGIKHINQMHGERFPYAGHSFCEFDQFNVWGEYFKEMFIQQRCPPDHFLITGNPYHKVLFNQIRHSRQPRPKRLLIIHNQILSPNSSYYFSLIKVLKIFDPNWEIRLRLHYNEVPQGLACMAALQADKDLFHRNIKIIEESHTSVSLEDALGRSRIVVGAYSTAMLEAWIAGCKVIHLPGEIDQEILMRRYGGSSNVIYADDITNLENFLNSPAVLNVHEDELVDAITKVIPDSSIVN